MIGGASSPTVHVVGVIFGMSLKQTYESFVAVKLLPELRHYLMRGH